MASTLAMTLSELASSPGVGAIAINAPALIAELVKGWSRLSGLSLANFTAGITKVYMMTNHVHLVERVRQTAPSDSQFVLR